MPVTIKGGAQLRMASCPSCGGPLRFRGATSVVAVCQYCRATLVRDGARLEDIGKQAELLPDDTLLQVGATGYHRGEPFSLVGRIQYRYGAGMWNEWHALFDRGRSAWLSDANRDYTISYLMPPAAVPAYATLQPDMAVTLGGERYTVTNIEEAEVVAGEGELPFKFESGWKAPVADLRGAGARFATIDYSEDVPHIYVGERLPFDTFRFDGLRDPDRPVAPGVRAIAFKCAGCGAPIEKHVTTTEVVACGSCGSVTDVTGTAGEIVQKSERNAQLFMPSIPLGSVCTWRGADYEVVGYMRRRITVEGEHYEWAEYLLHNLAQGYYWISEYQGHFSLIKTAAEQPKVAGGQRPDARYLGRNFRHFQHSEPEVTYLIGEFNWRVQLGEKCVVDDYVAPPLILSSEKTDREITWSVGEYVEPEVLWKAFRLEGRAAAARRRGTQPALAAQGQAARLLDRVFRRAGRGGGHAVRLHGARLGDQVGDGRILRHAGHSDPGGEPGAGPRQPPRQPDEPAHHHERPDRVGGPGPAVGGGGERSRLSPDAPAGQSGGGIGLGRRQFRGHGENRRPSGRALYPGHRRAGRGRPRRGHRPARRAVATCASTAPRRAGRTSCCLPDSSCSGRSSPPRAPPPSRRAAGRRATMRRRTSDDDD